MKNTQKPSGLISKTDLPMSILNGKKGVFALQFGDWHRAHWNTVWVNL